MAVDMVKILTLGIRSDNAAAVRPLKLGEKEMVRIQQKLGYES